MLIGFGGLMQADKEYSISVVLNVYKNDRADLFEKALKSMLSQTHPADEILILRNGPVPEAIEAILDKYSSKFACISIVKLPDMLKRGPARHKGILRAKHKYVALMDADDESCKNRLEVQIKKFKEEELHVVGGQAKIIDYERKVSSVRFVPLEHYEIIKFGKRRYPFNNVTLMFDREKYCDLNYEQTGNLIEDYDLFLEFVKKSWKMANVKDEIVEVRFGLRNYDRRHGLAYLKEDLSIQAKKLKIGYISLWQYFVNVILRILARLFLPKKLVALFVENFFRSNSLEFEP